ncbi:ATP-binding protein [Streptomyces sp. NBC_01450]|uniref:ATP-binding protein n=1 Tax=Streptomyces sp. NBC_01450 TaxID=2903871 RepID=UPI003FCC7652
MAPDTATAVRLETRWAVIEVRDSGPGIPADILPRVFDRSCTSDTARTRTEGSGLGLSICGIPETGVVEVGEPATGIRPAQVLLPWGLGG